MIINLLKTITKQKARDTVSNAAITEEQSNKVLQFLPTGIWWIKSYHKKECKN